MSMKMKRSSLVSTLVLGSMLSVAAPSQAANWSSTSFLMHSGSGYKTVPGNTEYDQTIVTLEHADGWKYGDNFFFFDVSEPNNPNTSFYGEFSPRLSLSKISGKDLSFGIVKDVSLAATWEFGGVTNAKLFGFGFDLDIPGVPVAKVNVYNRFGESQFAPGEVSSAPQVTLVWMAPFSIGYSNWIFEGFLDYAWAEKEVGKEDNIVAQPRLLMDVGDLWGAPKQLYAGIEYSYWMNKYGSKGVDEGVPQLTIKWTF
ncbi:MULTISPECIES: outer membrane protein OmpK [Thiomicrorhabdus]|uniref:DUF5020 domain-containing protein n=1 Tax=Thiomicrorhabdus heinhorstiae TaxID=2748010 RepID=A0ABS0BXH8_9GAMM|nr:MULTISPECIES: outer membrane protein OmpK [Thiomicrorhabdus]MBF6058503.1 DUF5020 domain-containing protein [Thiomicrorhabdus heinhorstiae]